MSTNLVEQVLKRCKNLGFSARRFFLWAKTIPGLEHNFENYQILVDILGSSKQFAILWDFLIEIRKARCCEINPKIFWVVFKVYSGANLPEDAIRAFNRMVDFDIKPGVDDLDQLLYVLCKRKHVRQAQQFFDKVKSGLVLNAKTYTILMGGWGDICEPNEARKLFDEMLERGCKVDVSAYNSLLEALCKGGNVDEAYKMFREMDSVLKYWLLPSRTQTAPNSIMSKTLLSRIKPLHRPKPIYFSSSPFPCRPYVKLVQDCVQILKNHEQWEKSLEIHFAESQVLVSDIAHHVLDRIHDVELGLKFFDWASKRPYSCSLDGYAYSSLLRLLARFKVFSEIELVLKSLNLNELKLTPEALSAVIHAYADSGLVDKALEFYFMAGEMHECVPSVYACNSLLDVLVKHRRTEIAFQVYDEMLKNSCVDNYSTCIMVRCLSKEGKANEGKKLIENMWGEDCVPNVVFYNTLIDGYCKRGDIESASRLFKELKLKGFLPTSETYGAMIYGFCKEGNFEVIDRLLVEMKDRGLNINVQVYNNIIDAQNKHHHTVEAVTMMGRMIESGCEPDIITYNTLINGSCRERKVKEAEKLLEQALQRGLKPNKFTYTPLIHGYCRQGEYLRASDLLIKMMEEGEKPDLVSYGALMHGLVVTGQVDAALTMRDNMMERGVLPDAGIYNVLMSGLCRKGRLPDAKRLLAEMLDQNIQPDEFVYTTLVDGLIRNGDIEEAKQLFELAIEKGIDPGVVGYNAMIKGFCKFGMIKDAFSCLSRMRKGHHAPDVFTYTTLIDGYIKQNDLDGALRMFGLMLKQRWKPNVVTYTSLIMGFCSTGDSNRAEKTFREMQSCGLEPNVVTYSILIGRFCKECKLAKAASFFELMLMNKCVPNDVTFHYLVNGFANTPPSLIPKESNELQESSKSIFLDFFGMMMSDGWMQMTATYNSIIVCLCQHGMVKTALQLQDKMISKGFLVDSVSFTALLHGICLEGRSGEWKEIIACNLNEKELQTAVKYSLKLNQYASQGRTSEAPLIVQTLIEDKKSNDPRVEDPKPQ
ncbi:hypothetical protein F2P56_014409 [Juglans regia]|nr:hypothetical protein F2P56_014409 [Juglans regia]